MSVLNAHDQVSRVVNPLEVGRSIKVKSKLDLVVTGIQLDEMFDRTQLLQRLQVISRNVDVLQILILLHPIQY